MVGEGGRSVGRLPGQEPAWPSRAEWWGGQAAQRTPSRTEQTAGRFMASAFPESQAIMHVAGGGRAGWKRLGMVLKFHFSFLSGAPRGLGQLADAAARIISHCRIQPLAGRRSGGGRRGPAGDSQVPFGGWRGTKEPCQGASMRPGGPAELGKEGFEVVDALEEVGGDP